MPSKLTSILAAGGCALVSAIPGTTLYNVIDGHQMGILIEPESTDALIKGIEKALTSDLTIYQQNAQSYAKRYLSKQMILQEFNNEVLSLQKDWQKEKEVVLS